MSGKNRKYTHVTMKTIAEKLGISVTTVSRSMEDGYKISPETVAKIRDMANRLGYVRNLDVKKLSTGKTLVMNRPDGIFWVQLSSRCTSMPGSGQTSCSDLYQSLLQIFDDVVDMFYAYR